MQIIIKTIISAILIVLVAEIARKNSTMAGILASLPITSLLAFIWLYSDTKDVQKVADLAVSIKWMIVPSLVLFIILPILLQRGIGFYKALLVSMAATSITYFAFLFVLTKMGIKI